MIDKIEENMWIIQVLFLGLSILYTTMIVLPIWTIIYIYIYYNKHKENPYIRNKKSKEINIKLEGLKKYIKDYSLLNEKTSDDITVWEDYLIYSVMFGQNGEVVNEIMSKVNGDDR